MQFFTLPAILTLAIYTSLCSAAAAATTPACSKQPYKALSSALATYPAAQKYCSSKYPISTVTTTTITTQKGFAKRAAAASPTPKPDIEVRALRNEAKCSSNLRQFTRSALSSAVSTFCSCIETTPTTTVTSTVTDLGVAACDPNFDSAFSSGQGCDGCDCIHDNDGTSAYCAYPSSNGFPSCSRDADCAYGYLCGYYEQGYPGCFPGNECTSTYVPPEDNGGDAAAPAPEG